MVGVADYGLPASDWSYGYARSFSRRASAFDRFDFEHLKMLDTLGKWRMAPYLYVITGEPNELVREIHTRMPVILPEEHHDAWLSGEAGKRDPGALSGNSHEIMVDQSASKQSEE